MRRLGGSPSGSGCTRHDGAPQAERAGNAAIQRGLRTRQIECQQAAHEAGRVKPAEHEVDVGDRRLGAAAPVADRAGPRAGTLRANLEPARTVEPDHGPLPAPMVRMSTMGTRTGSRSISPCAITERRPFWMMVMS